MENISTEDLINELFNRGYSSYKSDKVFTIIAHGETEDLAEEQLKEAINPFIVISDARPNCWDPVSPSEKCKQAKIKIIEGN